MRVPVAMVGIVGYAVSWARGTKGVMVSRRWSGGAALLTVGVLVAAALAGCTGSGSATPSASPSPTAAPSPVSLTFGVFGPDAELVAYSDLARAYTAGHDNVNVTVVPWADRDAQAKAFRSGEPVPDVFMLSQRDLAWALDNGVTQPVDELLDARGVSFGDDYARDALAAFAGDNSLACMPYSISPMVIYYNTDLIDFDRMRRRGLDAPEELDSWNFDQFTAAAEFATRPARGTRGVYIAPSLQGLAPFIYSGGGQVFDEPKDPTSLAFSTGDTQSALEATLTLLRDAQVTPTPAQLAEEDPLTLFKEGKLGMIAGFRNLTPELRTVEGLSFDVMPMPRITRSGTVGDVAGMCIAADTDNVEAAADFLVNVLSEEAVATVASQGYIVPANVAVATSDAFLQPTQLPANAAIFNASVRDIVVPPQLDSWARLEAAAAPGIHELLTVTVLDEAAMDDITGRIDEASQPVLNPPSPSSSPSATPSS
ncbi:MAG TPA: extracellular solute-binding protein [Nocardioides sp.]|uniref:ABC transporter substrate-binding protein n=1 Tax=Nocardioides sp. TaxID=35761 RepID=UPI002CF69A85|nr:extracellular solute-binding protein [Nocardioides sp.]HQR28125.1 extracellular solute-binding protein [Nocardioides sp.]